MWSFTKAPSPPPCYAYENSTLWLTPPSKVWKKIMDPPSIIFQRKKEWKDFFNFFEPFLINTELTDTTTYWAAFAAKNNKIILLN